MHKRFIGCLFLGLFLGAGNVWAETVYVHDYLRLGVRTHPNSSEAAIAVVTTGDALTVLERQEGYLKVRAEDGTEGWVSDSYVSSEKPARLLLEQLQKSSARNEAKLKELETTLAESKEKNMVSEKQLSALMGENAALKQQVSEYRHRADELTRKYAWAYEGLVVLIVLLFGFYLGVRWHKRRLAGRLGGLEI